MIGNWLEANIRIIPIHRTHVTYFLLHLLPIEGSSEAGSLCQLMLRSVYIILVTICFDYYMAVVDEILLSLVSRIANSMHIADVG